MILRLLLLIVTSLSLSNLSAQVVNYHADIAPILEKNCVVCHQDGQIGPMPLTTYAEALPFAKMMTYVIDTGLMPPYLADAPQGVFEDEKHLTEAEKDLFRKWLDTGLQEGKPPADAPQNLPEIAPFLTDYDTVISMSESFEQYGVYYDQFRVFVLPTDFKEDKIIEAIEFVPGNPDIVRGCNISVDRSDKMQVWDDWDPKYGYYSFGDLGFVPEESRIYNWYPGKTNVYLPENTGRILPAGAKLLLHIHYGPTGIPQPDSSSIRLKFAKETPDKLISTLPLINSTNLTNDTFLIRENQETRVHASFVLPFAIEVYGIQAHAHFLAREWEVFAVLPTRKSEILLKIEEWDFHHKQKFTYLQPKILPAGTVIHTLTVYDNTISNLFNPSEPPRTMSWGKGMYKEMFMVFFDYTPINVQSKLKVQILQHPSLISSPNFEVSIHLKKRENLTVIIKDFAGKEERVIYKSQNFRRGKQMLTIDIKDLPHGNYYLLLQNEQGNEIKSAFVYLPVENFD